MITVLTPTYNRKWTLERLYLSLSNQSLKDFEWVVVDDGSTDDTASLIMQYKRAASFDVRYYYQENAGKHIALNTGCAHSKGDYIFIVDSDDALDVKAIEIIIREIAENPGYVGYCFRKKTFCGQFLGVQIVSDKLEMSPTAASHVFKSDLAYVFSKESMVANPFPKIDGEKFVPELFIWNRIADEGGILFFPDEWIYLCEYLPDGYSMNFSSNIMKNPKGFALYYWDQFRREFSPVNKSKALIRYLQCRILGVLRK